MVRISLAQSPLVVAAAALLCGAPAASTSYYIDFERGSDLASGLSPETAWKRAPGDSRAGAGPRAVRLQPGDILFFRGGVAYRGTVVVRTSGTSAAPIRYVGDGWGAEPAVLDGSEPAALARPCRSARECGDEAGWAGLYRMSLASDQSLWDGFFQQDQVLALAGPGEPLQPGTLRLIPGTRGRTVLIRPFPGIPPLFSTGAGRVGFLLVAGGHVEIRGFRTSRFIAAPRFGPYAGWPLVQLQPMPGVRLVSMPGAGAIRQAAPVGPVIAGVSSGPI